MRSLLLALGILLVGSVARADDVPCLQRDLTCALPADLDAEPLFQARVEMELRRLGGPRREVLVGLLSRGDRINSAMWGNYVLNGCELGVLNCGDYLDRAAERAAKAEPRLHAFLENQRRVIAKEALLETMGKGGRHALYERALAGLAATTEDGVTVYRTEAVDRAMREGFRDLVPAIRRTAESWLPNEQLQVARYIAVAEARADRNPAHALAQLVRRGAAIAVESADESARGVPLEQREDVKDSSQLASMALDALRRLGDRGILEELKETLKLYRSLASRSATAEARLGGGKRTQMAGPRAYLGTLGTQIAEAIGDLGDREFERQVMGGRTYWDKINEAERKLVKEGSLSGTEMVSQ